MIIDLLLFTSFVITSVLAFIILKSSKKNAINYFFGISILGASFWQISTFLAYNTTQHTFWATIGSLGPTISIWNLFVFLNNYPKRKLNLSKFAYSLTAIPSILFIYLIIFTPRLMLESFDFSKKIMHYGQLHTYFGLYIILGAIILFSLLIHNIFTYKGIDKLKSKYLLLGCLLSMFAGIFFNLILPYLEIYDFNRLGPMASLFLIGVISYSIIKNKLMTMSSLIKKGIIIFGILISFVFIIISIVSILLEPYTEIAKNNYYLLTMLVASSMITILYPLLLNFYKYIFESMLFKQLLPYEKILKNFENVLITQKETNYIFSTIIKYFSEALKPTHIKIFYLEDDKFVLKASTGILPYKNIIRENSKIIKKSQELMRIIIKDEIIHNIHAQKSAEEKIEQTLLVQELNEFDTEICLPLFNENKCSGIVLLGPKKNEKLYSRKDLYFLDKISNQLNIAIQNCSHYEALINNIYDLRNLNLFFKKINKSIDINEIFDHMGSFLNTYYGIEKFALAFCNANTNSFRINYFWPFAIPHNTQIESFECSVYKKMMNISQGKFIEENVLLQKQNKQLQKFIYDLKNNFAFKEILLVPLSQHNKMIGALICSVSEYQKLKIKRKNIMFSTVIEEFSSAIQNAEFYYRLLEMKNFNAEILKNMISGVITCDSNLIITSFNSKAEEMTRFKAKNIIGKHISYLYQISDIFSIFEDSLATKESYTKETTINIDDKELFISLATSVLKNTKIKNSHIIGVLSDLTSIKNLQNQVEQANKLSSLGTMAAGVAHEIKNPLVAIKTFSDLAPKMWEDPHFRQKYTEIVGPQIDRINGLCQSLLKLSRKSKNNPVKTPINQVIQDVLTLIECERKAYSAEFETDFEHDLMVFIDPNELNQIIINLLLNAMQALKQPEGGKITISTKKHSTEYVTLIITDNGVGIDKQQLKNVYDPFYTTKKEGSGLGLSIVHNLTYNNGGKIEVQSELNKGTSFTIYLPTKKEENEKKQLLTTNNTILSINKK